MIVDWWTILKAAKKWRQTTLPEHDWRLSEETGWPGVPPVSNWTAYPPGDRQKWLADEIKLPKNIQWSVARDKRMVSDPDSPVVQQFGRARQEGGKFTVVGLRGREPHGRKKSEGVVRVTPVDDLPPPEHRYVGEHEVPEEIMNQKGAYIGSGALEPRRQ